MDKVYGLYVSVMTNFRRDNGETERILDKAYTLYVAVMTNFIAPKNDNEVSYSLS